MNTQISIVICTYNRAHSLSQTLESIRAAHEKNDSLSYEIVIVDNNSKDDTKEVVESYIPRFPVSLRYVFEPRQGKPNALNRGVRESRGDIIVFTDDDVTVDKEWLTSIYQCFQEHQCDGVGGRVLPVFPEGTPAWIRENPVQMAGVVVILDYGVETKKFDETMGRFIGANYAFRRSVFDECGPFLTCLQPGARPLRVGEDREFVYRLLNKNKTLYYCGRALVHHPVDLRRLNLRHLIRWHTALGRFEAHVESEDEGRIKSYLLGVPRYLWSRAVLDFFRLFVCAFHRKTFFNWIRTFFRKIGMIREYRLMTKVRAVVPRDQINPAKAFYKKVVPLKWRVMILEILAGLKLKLGLVLARGIVLFSRREESGQGKTVLFWPDFPDKKRYVLHKVCYVAGTRVTHQPESLFHGMLEWEDVTVRRRTDPYLKTIERYACVNAQCLDISKERVDRMSADVFGYSISVDPLVFQGPAVKKSNLNALHNGEVIQCPVSGRGEGFVYQKLINNEFDKEHVYDIRIPILGAEIPFVYCRYRMKADRFDNYFSAQVVRHIQNVFSSDEIDKILEFSRRMGLQYGELDALRDTDDGRLYIVDVNNTPAGPRADKMPLRDLIFVLVTLADSFDRVFLREKKELLSLPEEAKEDFNAVKNMSPEGT